MVVKTKNNNIIIQDWTGKILYQGSYKSKQVDKVLEANKCDICKKLIELGDESQCHMCDGTGYAGDFEVIWENEADHENDNVYEFINY